MALLGESAELARAHGSPELEASAIDGAGLARFDERDLAEAARLLDHNVELARQIGNPRRTALALVHAAKPAEPARALELLGDALSGFRALGQSDDRHNIAKVVLWRGRKLGDRARLEEALAIMSELGRDFDRAQILDALGDISTSAAAADYYLLAARIYEELEHLVAAAASLRRAEAIRTT